MPGKPGSSTRAASPGSRSSSAQQAQALADARGDDDVVGLAGDAARLAQIGGDGAAQGRRAARVRPLGRAVAPFGLEQAAPDLERKGVLGRPAEGEGVGHRRTRHVAPRRRGHEAGAPPGQVRGRRRCPAAERTGRRQRVVRQGRGDARRGARPRRQVALGGQLLQRQDDGAARAAEVGGQDPRGREPGPARQPAFEDRARRASRSWACSGAAAAASRVSVRGRGARAMQQIGPVAVRELDLSPGPPNGQARRPQRRARQDRPDVPAAAFPGRFPRRAARADPRQPARPAGDRRGGGLTANPIPFLLDDAGPHGVLRAHLARANPQGQDLAAAEECLVVFQGPQGYVTPSWYASKSEHGRVVPTWNYATVHAWGRPRVIEDADWLQAPDRRPHRSA